MTSTLIAHLLGRLIASYIIVWICCFLLSRFDWRKAFRLTSRWYNVLIVLLLTILGVGVGLVSRGSFT